MAASSVVDARSELRLGSVSGYFRFLFLCDVAEEIDLELLTTMLGDPDTRKSRVPSGPASPWNQFERRPVIQALPPLAPNSGRSWDVLAKYYEYGVIAVEFTMPIELAWSQLVPSSADHISNAGLDVDAAGIARGCLEHARPALKKPYDRVANEDYAIVELRPARLRTGGLATARELIEANGAEIASMLRGEATALSKEEASHILQSRMSYYPTDLVVAGWAGAVVCDTPSGAETTIALLEYANIQLLELKHYDDVLTQLLSDVYRSLEKRGGFLARWRLAREAERLGTMRLDIRELTERIDNSTKFLSDSYSARLYRMVAARLGVPDYRKLVDDKLRIAADLHRFMMDRFHQGSAFILELMIVIILIIDLAYLFWPRS